MKSLYNQVSFSGGEWSPLQSQRVDKPGYKDACRQLQNFICIKQGGATRRPGLQSVSTCKFSEQAGASTQHAARPLTFQYSPAVGFVFEFGHNYVRFNTGGSSPQQVVVSSAVTWTGNLYYPPGSYSTDPSNGLIYYTASGVTSTLQPHSDNVHWVQQTILEQPTPYCGLYYIQNIPVSTGLVVGNWYSIVSLGNTNFTSIGAGVSPTVGTYFQATGFGTGTGVVNGIPPEGGAVGGAWTPGVVWTQGQWVSGAAFSSGVNTWRCVSTYTSTSSFSKDLANGYWVSTPYPTTPWDTDVFDVVECQINDVVYFAHPFYPPQKLTSFTSTNWTVQQVNFLPPPLLDQNATDTTLQASGDQGSVSLTVNAPVWSPGVQYEIGDSQGGPNTVPAGQLIIGQTYVISTVGTTNWVAIGAVSNTLGVQFTATGAGSGTGNTKSIWNCVVAHVSSGSFNNDLLAGYWVTSLPFNPQHIGSSFQLAYLSPSAYLEVDATGSGGGPTGTFPTGASASIQSEGGWSVFTTGIWSADIAVQQSLDGGQTWNTVLTISGRFDRNANDTGTAVQLSLYRLYITNVSAASSTQAGPSQPRVVFENDNSFLFGLVNITSVTNAYLAQGTVTQALTPTSDGSFIVGASYVITYHGTTNFVNVGAANNTVGTAFTATNVGSTAGPPGAPFGTGTAIAATEYWSEPAFSNYRGFPQAVTAFQQRTVWGSTGYDPQSIWGSVSNDLESFYLGDQTLATDSYAFQLAAVGRGPLQWLVGQQDLFAGFSGAEWVVNSGQGSSGSTAITPASINAVEQSTWGTASNVTALVVGNSCFYTQRQGKTVRQMQFSVVRNKYESVDLASESDHLFNGGIQQMAYQAQFQNNSILWVVTGLGLLLGFTYEDQQGVYAWHRHVTGTGTDFGFEGVTTLEGVNTSDDEVWVVVNRTLANGNTQRFMERFNPINWQQWGTTGMPNSNYAYHVDAGIQVVSPPTNVFQLNAGLANRPVIAYVNSQNIQGLTANSSGQVVIPGYTPATGDVVSVGLPITYALQPMALNLDPRAGVTMGLDKVISDIYIFLNNSLGGNISNGTQTVPIPYSTAAQPIFTANTMFTGQIRIQPFSTYDTDPPYTVTGTDALPLTVLAMTLKYDVSSTV